METASLKYWKVFAFVLIAINLILIILLIIGTKGRPHLDNMERGTPGDFIIKKLNFNQQQAVAFNQLRKTHHDSIEILQEEGRKLRKSFFDGLKTNNSINNDSVANMIAVNQKQIELLTYHHFEKVKQLCTPEQKQIFDEIIEDVLKNLSRPPANRRP